MNCADVNTAWGFHDIIPLCWRSHSKPRDQPALARETGCQIQLMITMYVNIDTNLVQWCGFICNCNSCILLICFIVNCDNSHDLPVCMCTFNNNNFDKMIMMYTVGHAFTLNIMHKGKVSFPTPRLISAKDMSIDYHKMWLRSLEYV